MGQPATAGAIVGAIFGIIFASFAGYHVYKWYNWRKVQKAAKAATASELPMTNDDARARTVSSPMPFGTPAGGASTRSATVVGSLYGETYGRDSWKKEGSRPGTPHFGPAGDYGGHRPRRSSLSGLLNAAPESDLGVANTENNSPSGSPTLGAEEARPSSDGEPGDAASGYGGRPRVLSSSSSTMALKRAYTPSSNRAPSTYASSTFRGSSGNLLAGHNGSAPPKRDTYLPHLPENRDKIQIVPPQPLGFGLGGMAQALDQRTLAFSKSSGIGDFDDDFSRGLVWQAKQGNTEAVSDAVAAGLLTSEEAAQLQRNGTSQANDGPAGGMSEEERSRYLAQGPLRPLTPSMRAQIHNHIYPNSQPNSIGMRTPDVEQSPRSRSPARGDGWEPGWTSSTSDIGPSVSQRGGVAPSQLGTGTGTSGASAAPESQRRP